MKKTLAPIRATKKLIDRLRLRRVDGTVEIDLTAHAQMRWKQVPQIDWATSYDFKGLPLNLISEGVQEKDCAGTSPTRLGIKPHNLCIRFSGNYIRAFGSLWKFRQLFSERICLSF